MKHIPALGAAFLAVSSLVSSAAAQDRPWLPWTEEYQTLIEACTKDSRTVAVGMSYSVPDNPGFEMDFALMFRRMMAELDADEIGSVAWDNVYFREWTKPQWAGDRSIGDYYDKNPPILTIKGSVAGCATDLKPKAW